VRRQRMFDSRTGKTMTPSAIAWETSQNRHVTRQAVEAACEAAQDVSYRKAAKQLAEESGEEKLLSATTVWNKKQEKGRELERVRNEFAEKVKTMQVPLPKGVTSNANAGRIAENTIQLRRYFTALGLFAGKRLEVISDGARWIGEWVGGIADVQVEHILCWYHLRKRIYEGFGAVCLAKEKRKTLEHEILGHLWKGETFHAVWILWGQRSSARIPKRIDDLIGYLLRKRRLIANYESRRQHAFWLASTRVERWNGLAVSDRCKHHGTSWTSRGVLAVALYAAEQKRKSNCLIEKSD